MVSFVAVETCMNNLPQTLIYTFKRTKSNDGNNVYTVINVLSQRA